MDDTLNEPGSILAGLDGIIDGWLGLVGNPKYGERGRGAYATKSAAIDLSTNAAPLGSSQSPHEASSLIPILLDRIDQNWKSLGSCRPSTATWQLRKEGDLADNNKSLEVVLERMVVRLLDHTWYNQIPTCSISGLHEGKRSIDLVHDCGDGAFEFIELKYGTLEQNFGTNHPLYAAVEILEYGLLFAHARINGFLAGRNPLLDTKTIHLRVLAPAGYYKYKERSGVMKPFEFGWFEASINSGLNTLDLPVTLDFQFQRFTPAFDAYYGQPLLLSDGVRAFQKSGLTDREPVYETRP